MDLASFFAETAEAVQGKQTEKFPAVPVSGEASGNGQSIANNDISRTSRISRGSNQGQALVRNDTVQAGARAGAGERARVSDAAERETREQRETLTGSTASSSRPLSQKREIERGTGNPSPLPGSDGLGLWRAGLARLVTIDPERSSSAAGYRPGEWPMVYDRAIVFLDEFGPQAEALGWTAPRLFGVHPQIGIVRVDCCGALVLPIGGPVRAITATEVSFGHLTHREKPGQTKGPPIWEFGR